MSQNNNKNKEESEQVSQKILLFEDIDVVFNDENDFYSQLIKLLQVTKVPIIMTASNFEIVKRNLIEKLDN